MDRPAPKRQQPPTCWSMEAGYQAWSRWKSDATVQRLRDYLTWPDLTWPELTDWSVHVPRGWWSAGCCKWKRWWWQAYARCSVNRTQPTATRLATCGCSNGRDRQSSVPALSIGLPRSLMLLRRRLVLKWILVVVIIVVVVVVVVVPVSIAVKVDFAYGEKDELWLK